MDYDPHACTSSTGLFFAVSAQCVEVVGLVGSMHLTHDSRKKLARRYAAAFSHCSNDRDIVKEPPVNHGFRAS